MKKIKSINYIFVLLLFVPAVWYLFTPGYFNMHDDLQVMRLFQMDKCLNDGQFPCRWSPDMAYGFGQAMFNYYSAFPYYLGALVRILFPISYLLTVKMLFLVAFGLGAVGMYLLAREFWGRWGGIVSAVLYTYAPYHALDVYVRGAMAESFALGLLPFLLYFLYKLASRPQKKHVIGASVTIALVLMTHNISTMLYVPLALAWTLAWVIKNKNKESIRPIIFAGALGVGLACFFILPAVYEQSVIQTQNFTQGYSDYRAHFVTLTQLFKERKWGDGPSIFGPYDDISFQVGWPHWWLGVLVGLFSLTQLKRKKEKTNLFLVLSLLTLFLGVTFLTHPKSLFIWEVLPFINFVQFPWRFLGLSIFFLSLAGGGLAIFKFKFQKAFLLTVVLATILLNYKYFIPVHYSLLITDEQKLTGVAFELQQKAAIVDYLPKTAEVAPPGVAPKTADVISGKGAISGFQVSSDRFSFDTEIYKDAQVVIPVMYFPNWIVIVDGKRVDFEIFGAHGVMKIDLQEGKHIVRGRFTNTPVRTVSNLISLLSFFVLVSLFVNKRSKK